MNTRIRELAKQADDGYTGDNRDDMGHALVGEDAIEKFAELIVRECVGLTDVSKVTRLEVIDEKGRSYTKYQISDIKFSLQDDERTLKIFLEIHNESK